MEKLNLSTDCKVLYGDGESFKSWLDKMRLVLSSEGFAGMEREFQSLLTGLQGKSKKAKLQRESVLSLLDYLRNNSERLHYRERLAAGRAIGSGLIEGACKNLVGRRMKQTGAHWRLERAKRQNGSRLFPTLRQPMEARMEKRQLNFYAPSFNASMGA